MKCKNIPRVDDVLPTGAAVDAELVLLESLSLEIIHGALLLSAQYTPESSIFDAQQSSAVVPLILPQPGPPQKPQTSRQQTVPISFSTPARPLGQLD